MACSYLTTTPGEVVRKVWVYNVGEDIPVQGRLNCKTVGFLYLLWSAKDPTKQYLGRCSHNVVSRLCEHRRSIINKVRGKAIPDHFAKIKSTINDLRFVPFKKIKSKNPHVLIEYERHLINRYNLVTAGVNMIL